VQTTMVYPHVLKRGGRGVQRPPDRLHKPSPVRAAGYSTASAAHLKQGGPLPGLAEVGTNKRVALWIGCRQLHVRPPVAGFVQVSMNTSSAFDNRMKGH
jgi:hypothetical protein